MKDSISSTEAFNEYLKELALEDFPTGNGHWKNSEICQSLLFLHGVLSNSQKSRTLTDFSLLRTEESTLGNQIIHSFITDLFSRKEFFFNLIIDVCDSIFNPLFQRNNLKFRSDLIGISEDSDYGQLMTTESLKELSEKKPFKKDVKWSKDVKHLQESCISQPGSIDNENIHLYIKHLRLVNRNINEIDHDFRKFSNLSELIISANRIETVNSSCLPSKLKVLELCGNKISDLKCLCLHPLALQHLGLSCNLFKSLSFHQMNPTIWSSLLSLDLSFNFLENITDAISILSKLPKLRNLLLQGNPLFLFPGYRGYIVDSIKSLTLLDDIRISADERYLFKGLSKLKELPFTEFVLFLELDNLKEIRKIDELEVQEDFPKTILKYVIEVDFIKDYNICDKNIFLNPKQPEKDEVDEEEISITMQVPSNSKVDVQTNVITTNEFVPIEESTVQLNFSKAIKSNDMLSMHGYLNKQVQIRVIENRILVSNEPKPLPDKGNLKEASKGSGRSRSKISVSKKEEKEKPKGKVAKKQDVELFEWSRTTHIVGSTTLDFRNLLLEESTTRKCEIVLTRHQTIDDSSSVAFDENPSKKNLKKKNKDVHRSSSRAVSSNRGASRMKMNKPETPSVSDVTTEMGGDISLTLSMELLRWQSAKDGLVWIQNIQK